MKGKNCSAGRVIGWLLLSLLAIFVFCTIVTPTDPKWVYPYLGVQNKHEALKSLGFVFAGVILIIQAFIANRRAKSMEKAANAQAAATEAQAEATKEQAKANENTEQGQRQERLKNAIGHLGHEKVAVRLGGAYELFHLARDSKKEEEKELRQTVLDILCAHIRETTGEKEYRENHKSKPSEEIQSLLTLLFVQEHEVFKSCRINLQGSWLNGAKLQEARLEKAVLDGAHLQRTDLKKARLQGAQLRETFLQGAVLWEAYLQGAALSNARLQGATLRSARLQGATLQAAQLQGADLPGTQLQGAELLVAELQGADLYAADLRGVVSQVRDLKNQFEERITSRTNQKDDLTGAIFEGGLGMSQEDLDALVELVPEEKREQVRQLAWHIGKQASHELPENSGAINGFYTAGEAEQWIAEYNEATKDIKD